MFIIHKQIWKGKVAGECVLSHETGKYALLIKIIFLIYLFIILV